jgi:hypothetical protein
MKRARIDVEKHGSRHTLILPCSPTKGNPAREWSVSSPSNDSRVFGLQPRVESQGATADTTWGIVSSLIRCRQLELKLEDRR